MKRVIGIVSIFLALLLFVSCGSSSKDDNKDPEVPNVVKKDFENITFESKSFTYDGTEKKIEITGTVPKNTKVYYKDNKGIEVGVYKASVRLENTDYNDLTLSATLIINNNVVNGITFNSNTFTYDGKAHSLFVEGLADTQKVSYQNNGKTEVGDYEVIATISEDDKEDFILKATLSIISAKFTDIVFEDKTFVYDGEEKSLEVINAPEGTDISYSSNNPSINAGVYEIHATLSKIGYETIGIKATLIINKADIKGIEFNNKSVTYNKHEHNILIEGDLPSGVVANYVNNKATDAGIYNAKVTLSSMNYNSIIMNAVLTIHKAELEGISFKTIRFTFDKSEKVLLLEGNIPHEVNVKYTENKATEIGNYIAVAHLTSKNYKDKLIEQNWSIIPNIITVSTNLLGKVLNKPNPWDMLPEPLHLDNIFYNKSLDINFNNFVSTESFSTGFGKQMNQIYDVFISATKNLGYVTTATTIGATVISLYETYINSSPADYSVFEGTALGMSFKLLIDGEDYKILVKVPGANLELSYSGETNISTGRIQIIGGNILKYEVGESTFNYTLQVLGISLTSISFEDKTDKKMDKKVGYINQFIGIDALSIKTTSVIEVTSNYTTISGNKGDFITGSKGSLVELYDSKTGQYLGSEVKEEILSAKYDTLWVPIQNIGGINNIKVINEPNGSNKHTVYVNNSSTPFVSTKNTGVLDKSRRYDIEMKTNFYYIKNVEDNTYSVVEVDIPMMFIQRKNKEEFIKDFLNANGFNVTDKTKEITYTTLESKYKTQLLIYEEVKDLVTYTMVKEYLGEKDDYFN
ncbi:MAG: MBG domain-containing protein [Anaeroplasmataceae bacterium]